MERSGADVLVLLAHNDDEYFAALRIGEEVRLGSRVRVAYLTHGSIYGADSEARFAESAAVLAASGIRGEDMLAIGRREDIFDLKLHERAGDAYAALRGALAGISIDRLYLPAWEGGHPDHDACHLIGVAFARERGLLGQTYELPCYNRLRVMKFPDDGEAALFTARDRRRALGVLLSARRYRTQRRTFLGLLPGSIARLLLAGRQQYRPVPAARDYSRPPHAGRLFYEKRFGLSFDEFIAHSATFTAPGTGIAGFCAEALE
ncbi:MAG TPA: PIG-L family deacetylase [Gammaproteobacteria bacterium]|nr:PIG-L family deacetylase [Gammaproteobacteria bacterium]